MWCCTVTNVLLYYLDLSLSDLVTSLMNFVGPRKARKAYRHFGPAPGVPHSHTKCVEFYTFVCFYIVICIDICLFHSRIGL